MSCSIASSTQSRPCSDASCSCSNTYLASSACDVRVVKKVPRGVFHPIPNVDSVLLGLRRHSAAPPESLRKLVQQGFAHRRKALARSLSLAPNADPGIRERTREALEALGHPADARAESLSPPQWRALWERLC